MPALAEGVRSTETLSTQTDQPTVSVMFIHGVSRPIEVHRTTLAGEEKTTYFIQKHLDNKRGLSNLTEITKAPRFKILRERLGILEFAPESQSI